MADQPRRAHERHDLAGLASGEVQIFRPMAIRQLSGGGALVEVSVPLQLDSLHDFRLTLGARSVVVKARVVHSHIERVAASDVRYHTGIEFVDVSEAVAKVIDTFLAAIPPSDGR